MKREAYFDVEVIILHSIVLRAFENHKIANYKFVRGLTLKELNKLIKSYDKIIQGYEVRFNIRGAN